MLRTSMFDGQETFVAVGRKTGVRRIVVLTRNLAGPRALYNFKTREGEDVAALGGGMYLILPTGEILSQARSTS
jgi:hypothetical protein